MCNRIKLKTHRAERALVNRGVVKNINRARATSGSGYYE
jgi:hypothetical protein